MKIAADKSKNMMRQQPPSVLRILEAQQTARSIIDTANGRAQEIPKDTDQFISAILENGQHAAGNLLSARQNERVDQYAQQPF